MTSRLQRRVRGICYPPCCCWVLGQQRSECIIHQRTVRAAGFAAERLQRGGRCHESEIWKAFEAAHPQFRSAEGKIKDEYLRDMVANWFPQARRTAAGFYKNVSLVPKADPFTGEVIGMDLSASAAAEEAGAARPPPL